MNKKSKRTLAGLTAFLTAFSATAIPQVADNIGISVVANAADDAGGMGSGTTATVVSTIALTVTAPKAGDALATTATVTDVDDNANYEVESVTWKEGDTAVTEENAGYNKAYTAEITVALKTSTTEGTTYAWADSVTAKIGENDVSTENVKKDTESGNITITYTFAATEKQTISEVNLSVTAPTAGETVPSAATTSDTGYTVESIEWYNGEDKYTETSFGYDTAYIVKITLKPNDDYKFGTNVTVNGIDDATATVGEDGKVVVTKEFDKTSEKTAPTADNFTFKAPTELTYDGTAKTATVTANSDITGMGNITVKYYKDDTEVNADNVKDAGTYTVKISVAEGDSYKATTAELSDTKWTFTITQATPTISGTDSQNIAKGGTFTAPTATVDGSFEYTYGEAKKTVEEINTAIAALDKDATGSISYTFTPDDTTNYETVSGTISFSIVDLAFYVDTTAISDVTDNTSIATIKTDPTYGDTWSAIVTPSTNLKAKIGDTEVTGTFSVKDGDKMPAVGDGKEYTIVFNSTDNKYTNVEVYTGKVTVAQKKLTVNGGSYTVTKEYDGTTTAGEGSGDLTLTGVVGEDTVSVKVDKIGDYTSADVTNDGKVMLTVSLEGENADNYTLDSTSVEVKGVITAKTIGLNVTIASAGASYTGSAIEPDVTVIIDGTDTKLEKDTDFTVEYANNTNAGKATATIKPVSGKNYTFEPINAEFTIEKATLTVEGTGTASGTYGTALSELTVSGLTANLGDKAVDGTWKITGAGSDAIPNVGETTATATFTPNDGAENYEPLTAEVTVTITKATYTGTIADTSVSFSKTSTDEKTVKLALPADITGLTVVEAKKESDENKFLGDEVSCDKDGNVKFTLVGTDADVTGKTATITVTFSSTNYENITAKLVISLTDLADQDAPAECKMTYTKEDGKDTYTVTIEKVEGAEYSFDGTTFSDTVNTKTGVAANTTVTGYIRMKATESANASPATSASITTPKLVSAAPTITKSATFTDSINVTITCTDTNATIYYTTDGTAPTTSSAKYSAPITLTKTTTIKAIAVSTGKEPSAVVTATFTKKSSSTGGGGSSSGGGGRYTGGGSSSSSTTKNPTVDGKEMTWNDVAKDIEKLAEGKEKTISLNGVKEVPADVIKAIANSKSVVTIVVNDVYSWTIDGSELDAKNAKALDLTVNSASVTGTNALRGIVGTRFALNGTNGKTELNVNFKSTHAGKFANLFKKVGDKLVFVDNVKLDKDGKAIGLEVSEKGDYVIMLGEYSDRIGDMDNDGILNAKDALAVLKDFAKLETGKNPLVADINGDGFRNALDALMILKMAAGIL